MSVSDTGPGLRAKPARATLSSAIAGADNTVSTGVGLANIRDRLAQAYGADHVFDIRTPPEGGFTVVIEIPHEREAAAEGADGAAEKLTAPPSVTAAPSPRPMGLGDLTILVPTADLPDELPISPFFVVLGAHRPLIALCRYASDRRQVCTWTAIET